MSGSYEMAVIGCIIRDATSALYVCDDHGMETGWLKDSRCSDIFRHAKRMAAEGKPIDMLTLEDSVLKESPDFPVRFFEDCVDASPSQANIEEYVSQIRKLHVRGVASQQSAEFAMTLQGSDSPEEDIAGFVNQLMDLSAERTRKTSTQVRSILMDKWTLAQTGATSGIPSPWHEFNKKFGGCHNGTVICFAGRQGKGKSAAMATWSHFLGHAGIPHGYLPFEDGLERTWARLAGMEADVNVFSLDTGMSTPEMIEKIRWGLETVMELPIYMDEKHMTAGQIVTWATRMKAKYGIKFLIVDAFKDILRSARSVEEDDGISQSLCQLARRLNIPILVNHHVRKQSTQFSKETWLKMDDVRSSGLITSDARQLILLQSEDVEGTENFFFEIAKNNYGPTGVYPMVRVSRRCRWDEAPPPPAETTVTLPEKPKGPVVVQDEMDYRKPYAD